MSENETLDLWDRNSARWRRLQERIKRNDPEEQIADEAMWCLYKTFQSLSELLPLEQLLDAAKRGDQTIHDVVRKCSKARDYAELIEQLAAIHSDPQPLVESVSRAIMDKIFDQIELQVVGDGPWPDLARFRVMCKRVKLLMHDGVGRLARKIADHPNEKPRMPARSADQKEKDQRALQNQSLLPRSGTHG